MSLSHSLFLSLSLSLSLSVCLSLSSCISLTHSLPLSVSLSLSLSLSPPFSLSLYLSLFLSLTLSLQRTHSLTHAVFALKHECARLERDLESREHQDKDRDLHAATETARICELEAENTRLRKLEEEVLRLKREGGVREGEGVAGAAAGAAARKNLQKSAHVLRIRMSTLKYCQSLLTCLLPQKKSTSKFAKIRLQKSA